MKPSRNIPMAESHISPTNGVKIIHHTKDGHTHVLNVATVKPTIREMVEIAGWLHGLPKVER